MVFFVTNATHNLPGWGWEGEGTGDVEKKGPRDAPRLTSWLNRTTDDGDEDGLVE